MTLLARLQTLGLAKETTPNTYKAPVRWIPVSAPKPEDVITELRDESFKGNDAILQGIYGGPISATFDYTLPQLYPDVLGDHLRAILGPDTITAGVATTLSASTTAGAKSITTAASIPSGSTVMIDTGSKVEYFTSGTPSGAGPYTIPVTSPSAGLQFAHTSSVAVATATLHTFAQDNRANPIPTYSLTQYAAGSVIGTRGYSGCVESDLDIKIDPKGAVTADAKWMGFPSSPQSSAAAAYSDVQPLLGWQWAVTLAGVASTRCLSGDYALKRATEAIQSSTGQQTPREIFADALESDLTIKAIFEDMTDYTQFTGYTAVPLVSTLTQPLAFGGAVLTVTNSGTKYIKFAADFGSKYLQADINASSAFNSTDSGVGTVTLSNFVTTAY